MRLKSKFRAALYGVIAILFATGAAWFVADRLKESPDGELWQQIAASLLMVHGGAAMVALLFLGALGPCISSADGAVTRTASPGPLC